MSGHKRIPYVQAQYASLDSEVTGQRSWYVQAGKQSGWQSVCVAACAGDEPGMRQATRPPSTSAPAATPGTGAPSRPARSAAKLGACGVASRDLSQRRSSRGFHCKPPCLAKRWRRTAAATVQGCARTGCGRACGRAAGGCRRRRARRRPRRRPTRLTRAGCRSRRAPRLQPGSHRQKLRCRSCDAMSLSVACACSAPGRQITS